MSQTLLVKSITDGFGLPLPFVLKVYDPRFYAFRNKNHKKPWSYAAEAAAAAKRPIRRNSKFGEGYLPQKGDFVGWEEYLYQTAEEQFHYLLVQVSFQGTLISQYFGAGELLLELEGRAISPRIIMLEFIPDAQRLDTVDPKTVSLSTARSLVNAAQLFDKLGVSHRDYNPGNILFSRGRGVIIDFGACVLREHDSDEEWAAVVEFDSNVRYMKKRLCDFLTNLV